MLMWFNASEHITARDRIFFRITRVVGKITSTQILRLRRVVEDFNPSVPLSEVIHKIGFVYHHHLVDYPSVTLAVGGTGSEQYYSDEKKQQLVYISHVHLQLKG
jgi:hypothetical protein